MFRRFIAALVISGSVGVLHAQHSATLILTSGERVTGVVGYQGDAVSGQPRRAFQILTSDGHRTSVAADEVAVVDFAGGRPATAELDALDADSPHVLILRNGNIRPGRLVGLVNGEFVRWENQAGARVDIPARNVSRIYINQDSALAQFDPRARPPASGLTGWLERGFVAKPEIPVPAATPWTDTAMIVRRGERLTFTVSGEIELTRSAAQSAGPAGLASLRADQAPVPDAAAGALIARIGNGRPFGIGGVHDPIAMPASGRLILGINDDSFDDNSGTFRVVITR